ncbi:MAG: hypothetical protein GY862_20885, partial [Gammaproteobacteria bacterium]|nr:hypothetical protein [Gammaproteobacteria bacterium]
MQERKVFFYVASFYKKHVAASCREPTRDLDKKIVELQRVMTFIQIGQARSKAQAWLDNRKPKMVLADDGNDQ